MTTDKAELFQRFWNVLGRRDYPPVTEERFFPPRRWRFDFAWPADKVAVEIEGNAWHVQGGGKHMQDSDLEKYNIATLNGWRVFRFSPGMLENDPAGCIEMILKALEVA